MPVTVPYPLGDPSAGYIPIPLVLWANAASGHADVYSTLTGFVQGQQLLDPQDQLSGDAPRVSADDLEIDISSGGTLPSGNAQSLLESLAAMAGDSGRIDEFLSAGGLGTDYSDSGSDCTQPDPYDPQTQFEEDSAGWPGGAYQNPDSSYYTPAIMMTTELAGAERWLLAVSI